MPIRVFYIAIFDIDCDPYLASLAVDAFHICNGQSVSSDRELVLYSWETCPNPDAARVYPLAKLI